MKRLFGIALASAAAGAACRLQIAPPCLVAPADPGLAFADDVLPHHYGCATDADCPAPATGTAHAACSPITNSCTLGCAGGETCPDGFVCIQSALAFVNSDGTTGRPPLQCVQYKELRGLPAN